MASLRRFFLRLLSVIRPGRSEPDLAREIAAHLTLLQDELERRGMTPDEARLAARRAFGGIEQAKERHRDARSFVWLDDARRDLKYALRLLRRSPVFTFTAATSLATGIGASITVFTAVNTLLLRTAPGVADADQLVDINRTTGEIGVQPILYSQYLEIRERATRLQHVYAYGLNLTPMSLTVETGQSGAEPVFASVVTTNYFAALGVGPAVGRVFAERDAESVVVLSHRFWTRRFNADPAVVGTALRLTDRLFTVVGVARKEFHGNTVLAPDVWVPFDQSRPLDIGLVGARLRPGVSMAEASAEIEMIGKTLTGDPAPPGFGDPEARRRHMGLSVSRSSPIPTGVRILVGGFLALLTAIVTLVLVIACTNVAGVLLARAAARRREVAVRLAMGVGRARLVRQLLTETILLFLMGGAAGLVLSRVMSALVLRMLPAFPLPADVSLTQDARVVAFALGVSFVAAVLSGLAPALHASNTDVGSILKAHEHGPASRLRLLHAFVVSEVALSVLLVVVGGLLARALGRAGSVDQGFDPRGVDVASLDLSLAGYTTANGTAFMRGLATRVRQLPDVESAALAFATPSAGLMGFMLTVPGAADAQGAPLQAVGNIVSPGYLPAMRIPIVAGRDFSDADSPTAEPVAILGEGAVRRFWPGISNADALGRTIAVQPFLIDTSTRRRPTGAAARVVGVASDLVRVRMGDSPRPFVYLPLYQRYIPTIKLLARSGSGRRIAGDLRALVKTMEPKLPILSAMALEDEGGPVVTQLRIAAAIAGSLGIVGFLLAAIGIYGVTAYMVARRTREIGIRVALGAGPADIVRMVLGEGMRLVAIGSAIGLVLATGAGRLLVGLLYGVPPIDPITFAASILLFAGVGLAACYVPVRRAVRVDPMGALRCE